MEKLDSIKIIFFDTNAFYNYVGRENISSHPSFASTINFDKNKFKNICEGNIKSLCSCSVMEMMTHFRNDKNSINNIINLINNNNFFISNVGPINYDIKDDLKNILNSLKTKNNLLYDKIMNDICFKKSKMEATWVYTFAAEISYSYALVMSHTLKNSLIQNKFNDLYLLYINEKIEKDKEEITSTLYNAYKVNNEKEKAKTLFYDVVWEHCLAARTIFEQYKMILNNKSYNKITVEDIKKEVEKTIPTNTENNKKAIASIIIKEFKKDTSGYNQILTNLISKFNSKNKMDDLQSSYIKFILDKLFKVNENEKSQEFKKNDIIDMIILGSISEKMRGSIKNQTGTKNEVYLVTFDNDLLNYLRLKNTLSYNLIKSFYNNNI